MTATSQTASAATVTRIEPAPRRSRKMRSAMFWTQRMVGVLLVTAAFGVWANNGTTWNGDLMQMKLLISLGAFGAGFLMLQTDRRKRDPEVEIDPVRREVRVVEFARSSRQVVERFPFSETSEADADTVRLVDGNDEIFVRVPESARDVLSRLALVKPTADAA